MKKIEFSFLFKGLTKRVLIILIIMIASIGTFVTDIYFNYSLKQENINLFTHNFVHFQRNSNVNNLSSDYQKIHEITDNQGIPGIEKVGISFYQIIGFEKIFHYNFSANNSILRTQNAGNDNIYLFAVDFQDLNEYILAKNYTFLNDSPLSLLKDSFYCSQKMDFQNLEIQFNDNSSLFLSKNITNLPPNFTEELNLEDQLLISSQGSLNITDFFNFYSFFGLSELFNYIIGLNFIFTDINFLIENYSNLLDSNQDNGIININYIFSNDVFTFNNPNSMINKIDQIMEKGRDVLISQHIISDHADSQPFLDSLIEIQNGYTVFQLFFWIVSMPLFIISIWLISLNIKIDWEKKRRRIGILRSKGLSQNEIKKMYYIEYSLQALMGIIIAFIISLSFIAVFGNLIINKKMLIDFRGVITSLSLLSLLKGIFIGFLIPLLIFRRLVKSITTEEISDNLEKFQAKTNLIKIRNKTKHISLLLIIGIIPIVLPYLFFFIGSNNFKSYEAILIYNSINNLSGILAIFAPFILIYSILMMIILNPDKMRNFIEKFISSYRKKHRTQKIYFLRKIQRNIRNSFDLVGFISLMLSLMFLLLTLNVIITNYQYEAGIRDGGLMGADIQYNLNSNKFFEYEKIMNEFRNISDKDSDINSIYYEIKPVDFEAEKYPSNYFTILYPDNWLEKIHIPDSWISGNPEKTLKTFFENENSIIVSKEFLNENELSIGSLIEVNYTNTSNISVSTDLEIVGSYRNFIGNEVEQNKEIFLNGLFDTDFQVQSMRIIIQSQSDESFTWDSNVYQTLFEYFNSVNATEGMSIDNSGSLYFFKFSDAMSKYVQFELVLLIFYLLFGLFSTFNNILNNRIYENGIIWVKGVNKKKIYKSILNEFLIYWIFSTIIGFLSMIGIPSTVVGLNNSMNVPYDYTLYIPIFKILILYTIISILSFILIYSIIRKRTLTNENNLLEKLFRNMN